MCRVIIPTLKGEVWKGVEVGNKPHPHHPLYKGWGVVVGQSDEVRVRIVALAIFAFLFAIVGGVL